jgi:DNA-binding transcriptional regulator YhcF (GntR family)
VFWTINERFDVERQVMRAICHEIARGAWSSGDLMPSPHVLAEEKILNPRVVESAYAKLVEAGLLVTSSGGAHQPAVDAQPLARESLLRWAQEDVRDLAGALRRAGLSGEDVRRVFREVADV